MALAALSLLLFLTAAFALNNRAPSADAADSETSALIGIINSHRSPPLSVSADGNADAQSAAQTAVNACAFNYTSMGHNKMLVSYGYETAQAIYSAWQTDSYYSSVMNDPNLHSVGIGRAKRQGCNWGYLWIAYFDRAGGSGGTTTPTHTPSPTSSKTPSPTPSQTASPTSVTATPTVTPTFTPVPTPSPTPTAPSDCTGISEVSVQCTPTPTPVPSDSPTPTFTPVGDPTPTAPPEMPGDADCDLDVDSEDGILVLMLAAHLAPSAPCLGLHGVNCQGLIDTTDVLAILSFLGNIPFDLPEGCPPLGIIITPSPTPVPTPSPTPTATPVATETPTATPTSVPTSETPAPGGEAIHNCLLALVSYQLETDLLNGELHCTPGIGTNYDCYFGNIHASCLASSTDFSDYGCSFTPGYADCIPYSGQPEYQCYLNVPGTVECLPTQVGYPTYECGVAGGVVTCTSDPPFPDFVCTKQTVDFGCGAVS